MQLHLAERVETLLHTLNPEQRKKILYWFDYLRNWEEEPYARSRSVLLDIQGQPMYLFRTNSEVRIFYTVDIQSKTIFVIDVTNRDTILATGGALTGVT